MKSLGYLYVFSSILSLTFAVIPPACTEDCVYCLNTPHTNSDIHKIITCKNGNAQIKGCLATEICVVDPTPHCAPRNNPQTPSLITPMPIPASPQSLTSSDTILPTPSGFPRVPSTADNPFTSTTDTTQLAARQTQASFRIIIYPQTSIRGRGTSFDTDRCISKAEIPWPIRSLVVERYFECMFWDKDDCLGSAGPRRKEGSSKDRKIIGDVKLGFEIKSLRCQAVPG